MTWCKQGFCVSGMDGDMDDNNIRMWHSFYDIYQFLQEIVLDTPKDERMYIPDNCIRFVFTSLL